MKTPPRWLTKFLNWCCPPDRLDILGDFEEWYQELAEERGAARANLIWFFQSITMLRLKAITQTTSKTQNMMIGLHLKIARRNLLKNKLYSSINLVGLAVGISVCSLIGLFINDELSYDRHFGEYDRVYRISGIYDQGGDSKTSATLTPYLLQPTMQALLDPGITYTRLDFQQLYVEIGERGFWEDYAIAVDSNFFEVFQTRFVSGDPRTVLDNPQSAVVDLSTAAKLFDGGNATGEHIEIDGKTYLITGVIEDLPGNTHFEGHLFIPIASIEESYPFWMTKTFGGVSHRTYLKIPENYDVARIQEGLVNLTQNHWPDDVRPELFLQPLQDIHLRSNLAAEIQVNGSYRTIYIFLATAIVILLLACINFVNLSVAGSLERLKEIGVKKVLGASKRSQVFQFQIEAMIIGFLASAIAVILVELALPLFNQVTGKNLTVGWELDLTILLVCVLLMMFISFIAGSFPALFLLRVPTSDAFSGLVVKSKRVRLHPRNLMVGLQFFLASVLISSTIVILRQLDYMQNKDLGIDEDLLIVVNLQSPEVTDRFPLMKEALLQQAAVSAVTGSTTRLGARIGGWRQYRTSADVEDVNIPTVVVTDDYFKTIGAEFVSGRDFDKTYATDFSEAYVINEAAAKFLELSDPVGQPLDGTAYTGSQWSRKNARIIGVVKDFHFASLHSKIRPAVFSLSSEATMPINWMMVKLSSGDVQAALETVERKWSQINPETPFRFRFVDEAIQEHYEQEARFFNVFSSFASLSIFIGCLGLFGLTAFIMRKRTKEIGIRKVLGASQLVLLKVLSIDFIRLVIIACILGIPVTIWFMARWLENFEYRTTITWWVFALTALGSIAAAALSIFYHSMRVSRANPVDSIKYE